MGGGRCWARHCALCTRPFPQSGRPAGMHRLRSRVYLCGSLFISGMSNNICLSCHCRGDWQLVPGCHVQEHRGCASACSERTHPGTEQHCAGPCHGLCRAGCGGKPHVRHRLLPGPVSLESQPVRTLEGGRISPGFCRGVALQGHRPREGVQRETGQRGWCGQCSSSPCLPRRGS